MDLLKKEIVIDQQETIKAKKIIIATGTTPNTMNAPGEKEYKGKGISYCATCDAKYFVDKEVTVIGGEIRQWKKRYLSLSLPVK